MSNRILLIETSTECCSVAISENEKILASRVNCQPKVHASLTAPYVKEVLEESGTDIKDIAAVAVSKGPGSYTGLRVGVSTAKGICFGTAKPLIAVNTLAILANMGNRQNCKPDFIVPFIDARRMEVYSAVFDNSLNIVEETEATILDEKSFSELLSRGKVLFIGTGVSKFKEICHSPNAFFKECYPLAEYMADEAGTLYEKKKFEDVAYFEPFYLKEFTAGISRKSLLDL